MLRRLISCRIIIIIIIIIMASDVMMCASQSEYTHNMSTNFNQTCVIYIYVVNIILVFTATMCFVSTVRITVCFVALCMLNVAVLDECRPTSKNDLPTKVRLWETWLSWSISFVYYTCICVN